MATLSWTPELATGISKIDEEHREIISLANQLARDPLGQGTAGGSLALLKFMEAHVTKHFLAEEEQMDRHDYPKMLEHMAEHRRLIEFVASLCRDVSDGKSEADVLSVSNRLLCNWMLSHIAIHDRPLADFLRSRQPLPAGANEHMAALDRKPVL